MYPSMHVLVLGYDPAKGDLQVEGGITEASASLDQAWMIDGRDEGKNNVCYENIQYSVEGIEISLKIYVFESGRFRPEVDPE